MNFIDAANFTLDKEVGPHADGGYTNDPDDPGGETKYGVSKNAYPNENIKHLTKERALFLYNRDYWIKGDCDKLPAHIRLAHFDMAINSGVGAAKKLLQKALRVKQDGNIGPKTIAAANRTDSHFIITLLGARQANFMRISVNRYRKFMRDNPNASSDRAMRYALKYSGGWGKRPLELLDHIRAEK